MIHIDKFEKKISDSYELPNNVLINVPNPIVSVLIITFQHISYIKQCIESVLMQKTSFPIEVIIGEDFSTDGTREIVFEYAKNYPNIIRVITADYNMHSIKGNSKRVKAAARGKYIALCESDDYWSDPNKLQKQVDFLEANPDYGMVHTDYNILYQNTGKIERRKNNNIPVGNVYEEFLFNSFIGTATSVFRSKYIQLLNHILSKTEKQWGPGDRVLWLLISSQSKVGYINEITTVYRRHHNSTTSFKTIKDEIDFFKSSYDVRFYFIENVSPVNDKVKNMLYRQYFKKLLDYYYRLGDFKQANSVYIELKKFGKSKKDFLLFISTKFRFLKLITRVIIGY